MSEYINKIKEIFSKRLTPPLCFLHSFGCQQNVSDGEKILGMLCGMGYGVTEDISAADLIIYNTCAVRENAELKVYSLIGNLKRLKENNPDLIIGICGCMAQEEKTVRNIKKSYRHVDLIFGTFAVGELPRLLYEVLTERKKAVDITEYGGEIPENVSAYRTDRIKASVPIMYGCNNFCSYCIVPYVRGRERSRQPKAVLDEVRGLAAAGYREIMLLGQNVNSYGKNLDEPVSFAELLREIDKIQGDFKIRFMSSHPKDATEELIDAIAECGKVCKHLHLPLQSGSDRILAAMNRNYTVEKYLKIVDYARSLMPDFSLSTDIIVGFPNETEEDFRQTLDVIKRVKFDNIFSFIYSKRTGTKAAEIEDTTPDEDKSGRMRELLEVQRDITDKGFKRFVGRTLTVLFDGESKTEGYISGKSDEFIIVEAKADKSLIGQRKQIKITKAFNWALQGETVE
ncbi:MAG: tRNA (N6-isopentenyl adenosine(37)-C2)-methylthiotransferase MiaB [Ruminococcus sp.]|nr:tRNA (N6-isopentenyl adenosine(37)-C2)-methylthiotransferase MiaB [Ruminococcus sp.]MCM1380912.1 tRNA (N6-isopentenyl adenosine(37)-C2)-methylthiotransferase MiaB [Muribaculaceae bacterium]MCM1479045.1 tRNA (N6-isopentenyl adenosine(37)-C2)-methylthiotransferase MiaB [Muribaculaceae bacterium]